MLSFHWVDGKIRVLESVWEKKSLKIKNSFVIKIEEDLWRRGEIDKIIPILKEHMEKNNIKEKDLHVTLETKEFCPRIMEFPNIPLKEIRENIIDELEELISFREETTDLNFSVIYQDKEKIKLLVLTYPKDIVNQWKDIAQKLNLRLKYIEFSSLSSLRGLAYENYDFSKNLCVLYIGHDVSDIYLFNKGKIWGIYNMSIGSSDFSFYENLTINTSFLSYIDEIRTYLSTFPFDLNEIIIIGEDESSIPLLDQIQEVFSDLPISLNKNIWLTSIGVSIDVHKYLLIPSLNLLGREKFVIKFEREEILKSLLAGILALIIIFSGNLYINLQINEIKRERSILEQSLIQRRGELEELRKVVEERISVNEGLKSWIENLNYNKILSPSYFLKDLSRIVPTNVWLSDLEVLEDNKISFLGYSLDSEGVADFLISLSYSNIFKDVSLQNSNLIDIGNKSVQNFKILAVIK